jgi:hypothetical protein
LAEERNFHHPSLHRKIPKLTRIAMRRAQSAGPTVEPVQGKTEKHRVACREPCAWELLLLTVVRD